MTCIVAVSDGRRVWMGGDSLATNSHLDKHVLSQPKVFVKEEFIFGVAGLARMLQQLSSKFFPWDVEHTDEYMYGPFTDQLKAFIDENDLQDQYGFLWGQLLVGFNGGIYKVQSDYLVIKSTLDYDSIGTGSAHALGSLASSRGGPKERITRALEAAVEHNAACGGPFNIISGAKKR